MILPHNSVEIYVKECLLKSRNVKARQRNARKGVQNHQRKKEKVRENKKGYHSGSKNTFNLIQQIYDNNGCRNIGGRGVLKQYLGKISRWGFEALTLFRPKQESKQEKIKGTEKASAIHTLFHK